MNTKLKKKKKKMALEIELTFLKKYIRFDGIFHEFAIEWAG